MVERSIPASLDQLSAIGDVIAAAFAPLDIADKEQAAYGVQLAVHELLVNVIEHGYAGATGEIGVRFSAENNRFITTITERGKQFDRAAVAEPNFDDLQVRGFGLYLIDELMDDVAYESQDGVNRWQLTKYLQGSTA